MNPTPRYRIEKCYRSLLAEGHGAVDGPVSPVIREAWIGLLGLPMPPPELAAVVVMFPTIDGYPGEWWHHAGKFGENRYSVVKWNRAGDWTISTRSFRRSGWSLMPRDLEPYGDRIPSPITTALPRYRFDICQRECVWEAENVAVGKGPEDSEVQFAYREFFRRSMEEPSRAEAVMSFPTGDVSRGEWWYRDVGQEYEDCFQVVKWDLLDLEHMRGRAALYELVIRKGEWSTDRPAGMGG